MKGVALISVSASNIWKGTAPCYKSLLGTLYNEGCSINYHRRVQHPAIRAYWEPYIMKAVALIIIEGYSTLL